MARPMIVPGRVLASCALVLLALHWDVVLGARWSGAFALDALMSVARPTGHDLGGPADDDRTVLAVACATHYLGIAVLVAASLPGPRTAVIIAVYILVSAAESVPYPRWRRRGTAGPGAEGRPRGATDPHQQVPERAWRPPVCPLPSRFLRRRVGKPTSYWESLVPTATGRRLAGAGTARVPSCARPPRPRHLVE